MYDIYFSTEWYLIWHTYKTVLGLYNLDLSAVIHSVRRTNVDFYATEEKIWPSIRFSKQLKE